MARLCTELANISAAESQRNCTDVFLAKNYDGPSWNFPAVYTAVCFILVVIFNGSVLVAILSNHDLRTRPFSMYLMFLMTYNISFVALQNPLQIINDIYPTWWPSAGSCRLYHYSQSVLSSCAMNTHALIAINRLWAITFPWSYR